MARQRILTPEERALWKQATKNDARFDGGCDEAKEEFLPLEGGGKAGVSESPPVPVEQSPPPNLPPQGGGKGEIRIGDLHALDGNTARRFKRGELPIDCVLDLHGYSKLDAYSMMDRTLRAMALQGERVLAVITGKGRTGEGVLRRELPHWLNDGAMRTHIVAACYAPARMGGEGAVLVLLKRAR